MSSSNETTTLPAPVVKDSALTAPVAPTPVSVVEPVAPTATASVVEPVSVTEPVAAPTVSVVEPVASVPANNKDQPSKLLMIASVIFILAIIAVFTILIVNKYKENKMKKVMENEFIGGYVETHKLLNEKDPKDITDKDSKDKVRRYVEGDSNWKFTSDENDMDCMRDWDYVDKDGKTVIRKNIRSLTSMNKNKSWCGTSKNTTLVDRGAVEEESELGLLETLSVFFGGAAGEQTITKLVTNHTSVRLKRELAEKNFNSALKGNSLGVAKKATNEVIEAVGEEVLSLKNQQEAIRKLIAETNDAKKLKQLNKELANIAEKIAKSEAQLAVMKNGGEGLLKTMATNLRSTLRRVASGKIVNVGKVLIQAKNAFYRQSKMLFKYGKTMIKGGITAFKNAMRGIALFARSAGKLSKIGFTLGKLSVKIAKALTSPAVIFDLISMALDLANVGGFANIEKKEDLYKVKLELDKNFKEGAYKATKETVEEAQRLIDPTYTFTPQMFDDQFPIIFDPLSVLEEDIEAYSNRTTEEYVNIFNEMIAVADDPTKDTPKPVQKYHTTLQTDIITDKLQIEDLDNEEIVSKYIELIDSDAISALVTEKMCKEVNGIMIDGECTLSEKACMSRNTNNPEDIYTEFRDGKCQLATTSMRDTCKEKKLPYNYKTGICDIDHHYCRNVKGADYKYNPNIKKLISTTPETEADKENDLYKDCTTNKLQQYSEVVVGTTIVRAIKAHGTVPFDIVKNTISTPMKYDYGDAPINVHGKCLDVIDGKHPKVILNECNNSNSQKFRYFENEDGKSRIMHRGTLPSNAQTRFNYCLEVPPGSNATGTNLYLNRCTSSVLPQQTFQYDAHVKQLKDIDGRCVNAGYDTNGTRLNMWDCNNTPSQQISIPRVKKADLDAVFRPFTSAYKLYLK